VGVGGGVADCSLEAFLLARVRDDLSLLVGELRSQAKVDDVYFVAVLRKNEIGLFE
jgi:hypothetical protein